MAIIGVFAAAHAPLVAKCMYGAFLPVDLRAVCLVRAMVLYVYGCGCCFEACTGRHITIVCVVVIKKPYEKTESYTSIDRNVHGRNPSP